MCDVMVVESKSLQDAGYTVLSCILDSVRRRRCRHSPVSMVMPILAGRLLMGAAAEGTSSPTERMKVHSPLILLSRRQMKRRSPEV
jgi:hypothetical protein